MVQSNKPWPRLDRFVLFFLNTLFSKFIIDFLMINSLLLKIKYKPYVSILFTSITFVFASCFKFILRGPGNSPLFISRLYASEAASSLVTQYSVKALKYTLADDTRFSGKRTCQKWRETAIATTSRQQLTRPVADRWHGPYSQLSGVHEFLPNWTKG